MSTTPRHESRLRLLPYPNGKTFAFTIIDDTDQSTLEMVRPIYDCLFSLGLRSTKTVWVADPEGPVDRACDAGDTLQRKEYAAYIRVLEERGFEIALHNVAGQSSRRERIAAGIECFREVLGHYPKINVQHEKNRENLYFDFAQRGGQRPPPFRTPAFQTVYRCLKPWRHPEGFRKNGCCGEDDRSEYFWGDICRAKIRYVRSNVFFRQLNTLRCNPFLPYTSPETPYVNYWFDSSNGEDVRAFNSILDDRQISALKSENGCAILYTHFGKGFVTEQAGGFALNDRTKQRLRAIAGHADGWYVPVGEILDRLLAFQGVKLLPLAEGMLLANQNPFEIPFLTLRACPGETYYDFNGASFTADSQGWIVVPSLPAEMMTALVRSDEGHRGRRWYEERSPSWRLDLQTAAHKLGERWRRRA